MSLTFKEYLIETHGKRVVSDERSKAVKASDIARMDTRLQELRELLKTEKNSEKRAEYEEDFEEISLLRQHRSEDKV